MNELLVAAAEAVEEESAVSSAEQVRKTWRIQDDAVPAALVSKLAEQLRGRC